MIRGFGAFALRRVLRSLAMTEEQLDELMTKLSPMWRMVWTFGKSILVITWTFGLILISGAKWITIEWVNTLVFFIANFLLFAMALGFDALAIARAMGWGRGPGKAQQVQPVMMVQPATEAAPSA